MRYLVSTHYLASTHSWFVHSFWLISLSKAALCPARSHTRSWSAKLRRSAPEHSLQVESQACDDKNAKSFSEEVSRYHFEDNLDLCTVLFRGTGLHDCGAVPDLVLFASARI